MPETAALQNGESPSCSRERNPDVDRISARQGITAQFATCKVGGMLLLKMVGFIEDQRAEILEVSEEHIVMRLGRPWYLRWWHGEERRRPISVRLDYAEPGDHSPTSQTARARRSLVYVDIRPMTRSFREAEFHRRAEDILRNLRRHFVAD